MIPGLEFESGKPSLNICFRFSPVTVLLLLQSQYFDTKISTLWKYLWSWTCLWLSSQSHPDAVWGDESDPGADLISPVPFVTFKPALREGGNKQKRQERRELQEVVPAKALWGGCCVSSHLWWSPSSVYLCGDSSGHTPNLLPILPVQPSELSVPTKKHRIWSRPISQGSLR